MSSGSRLRQAVFHPTNATSLASCNKLCSMWRRMAKCWEQFRNSSQFVVWEKDGYIATVFFGTDIRNRAGLLFLHVHSSSCSLFTFARTIGCSPSPNRHTNELLHFGFQFETRNQRSTQTTRSQKFVPGFGRGYFNTYHHHAKHSAETRACPVFQQARILRIVNMV